MSNPISRHFQQPANLMGTTLALGVLSAWGWVLIGFWDSDREVVWLFFPFTGLIGLIVLAVRLIRPFRKAEARAPSRCQLCGESAATTPVRYLQLTGAVVVMFMSELPVFACRGCSMAAFLRMTLHTTALGWWGLFSFIITPGYLLNNFLFLLRSLLTSGQRGHARRLLDERREYALNLIATKDEATVVDVLRRDTGLPTDVVSRYLQELRKSA